MRNGIVYAKCLIGREIKTIRKIRGKNKKINAQYGKISMMDF